MKAAVAGHLHPVSREYVSEALDDALETIDWALKTDMIEIPSEEPFRS
ncbi:MAG TPA: hypothetical protein PL182_11685 [Pseudobdellovibrionaceae bacterium]|nr:hypothetical protein [Pseudobdellovibrionaceae bacterium]